MLMYFYILLEIDFVSHGGALGVVGGPRAGGADQEQVSKFHRAFTNPNQSQDTI